MLQSLNIWPYRDLILHKAWADFRKESERTYLGLLWWVLDPIINTFIYYIVFAVIFKRGGADYVPFLTVGIVTWIWFSGAVNAAARSIYAHASFVRQVSFRKIVFPCSQVLMITYQFGFSLLVMFSVLLLYRFYPDPYWLLLPVVLFVEFVFILAVGFVLAALVPFVPDIASLVTYALRLIFFLSCVMYPIDVIGPKGEMVFRMNPMVHIILANRDVLMYKTLPDWRGLGIIFVGSAALLYVGARLIWHFDGVYAKRMVT